MPFTQTSLHFDFRHQGRKRFKRNKRNSSARAALNEMSVSCRNVPRPRRGYGMTTGQQTCGGAREHRPSLCPRLPCIAPLRRVKKSTLPRLLANFDCFNNVSIVGRVVDDHRIAKSW